MSDQRMTQSAYILPTAIFILILSILFVASCGEQAHNRSNGFGSVAVQILWPGKTTENVPFINRAAPAGVITMRMIIAGPNMTTMQQDFSASAGQGSISNVPAGDNRSLNVQGLDGTNTVIFEGLSSTFAVTAGMTTPVAPLMLISKGTWTTKTSMPVSLSRFGAATVNGSIYAISDWDKVYSYDPLLDSWSSGTTYMPTMRTGFATAVVNGIIYTIGGAYNLAPYATVEAYDPATDSWTTKNPMPTARSALSAVVVSGKIYALGGLKNLQSLSAVEEYDPATNTWSAKAPMPTARSFFAAAISHNKIYVFGGNSAAVEEYDPGTDSWSQKTFMPTGYVPVYLAAVTLNDIIYTLGGDTGSAVSTVEAYNPDTNTWVSVSSMPTARADLAATVFGGSIYALGGDPGNAGGYANSVVEVFTP